jgi:Zn-dependent M32 family carboxypeptidase
LLKYSTIDNKNFLEKQKMLYENNVKKVIEKVSQSKNLLKEKQDLVINECLRDYKLIKKINDNMIILSTAKVYCELINLGEKITQDEISGFSKITSGTLRNVSNVLFKIHRY